MARNLESVLSENEVLEMMKDDIKEAQNIIYLPVSTLRVFLDIFRWDSQAMMDSYFSNEKLTFEKANCVDPVTIIPGDEETVKTCEICLDDLAKTGMKHGACGHAFCFSCWVDYLRQSIVVEGKSLRLECPMLKCSAFLDGNFIEEVCKTDTNVSETYWRLLAKLYVDKKNTLSKCPAGDCRNIVWLKDPTNCRVKCSCGQEFCFGCSLANHYTVPCRLVEEWQAQAVREDVKFCFVVVMTKKCPNCKTDIEKDGGCRHMHCPRCNSDFCWKCLLPYKGHKACKEEVVGDNREVEAEVNNGMSEQKIFQLFQEKFKQVKNCIGFLLFDGKSISNLLSILKSGNDLQYETLLNELPIKIFYEDLAGLKYQKTISESNSKRTTIADKTRSGAMGTFEVITSSSSNFSRNTRDHDETASMIDDDDNNGDASHEKVANMEDIREKKSTEKKNELFISMNDIVEAIKLEMVKTTDLGWFPTDHLARAETVLEETQRVIMYSQVFAFYLGCHPSTRASTDVVRFHRLDWTGLPGALPSNDPRSIDADMFQCNLDNIEQTCKNLSDSLLKVTLAFLRLKSRMILGENGKQNESKNDLQHFLDTVEKTKVEILSNTAICAKRKDAVVSLMEDGFGERTWSFRTVDY